MATLREDTLELRWLFGGASPRDVRAWFGAADAPEERVDHYLLLPAAHELGIKLRDGRFEVKGRVGPPAPVELGRAAGVVEGWTKWSVEDVGPISPSRALASAAAPTLAVAKVRRRRAFALDGREVPLPVAPSPAFLAELTDLRVEERAHWTLAVEITARDDGRGAALCRFAAAWLADCPAALAAEDASSYAALVARAAGAEAG
ncbi:MAG: hypothetical protein H6704_20750 [Myxococcales bacterium]|nr:hypothetical protein [Myxococcales bacterium]